MRAHTRVMESAHECAMVTSSIWGGDSCCTDCARPCGSRSRSREPRTPVIGFRISWHTHFKNRARMPDSRSADSCRNALARSANARSFAAATPRAPARRSAGGGAPRHDHTHIRNAVSTYRHSRASRNKNERLNTWARRCKNLLRMSSCQLRSRRLRRW